MLTELSQDRVRPPPPENGQLTILLNSTLRSLPQESSEGALAGVMQPERSYNRLRLYLVPPFYGLAGTPARRLRFNYLRRTRFAPVFYFKTS